MENSLLVLGVLFGCLIGFFLGKSQIYFGTEEVIEKRSLFESELGTMPIGLMMIIKRTYKNGSSRIIKKKIMF